MRLLGYFALAFLVTFLAGVLTVMLLFTLVSMHSPAWSTPGRNPTHATPSPWPSR